MLSLSIVAASCAKKVVVRVKDGYQEPVNIFTVTALHSGNRKTTVFAAAVNPLEDYERSEALRTASEIAQKRTARCIKEARLRKLQEQAATAKGKDHEELIRDAMSLAAELAGEQEAGPVRLIADDCTPEQVASLLRANGGRLAILSSEGDVFELVAGRYSSKPMGNFGTFLKGHAGDTIRIDRVGRPAEHVSYPALTIGLAVQPDVIAGLAQKPGFRGRGLLARFLYAMPASRMGSRDTDAPSVPADVSDIYRRNVRALLDVPFGTDEQGCPVPHVLKLAPEGRQALRDFDAWIEPRLCEFGELGGLTDWAGKLSGAVVRIAGILHMAKFAHVPAPWEIDIEPDTVERAIQIGHYLIPHAKGAFALMEADPVASHAKRILRFLEQSRTDAFSKRDLHQKLRGSFNQATDLDPPLGLLVEHGYLRIKPEEQPAGPGRPASREYLVNPLWILNMNRATDNCEDSEDCEDGSRPRGQRSPTRCK